MKYNLSLTLIMLLAAMLTGCAADAEKNHGFSGANNPGGEEAIAAIDLARVFPDGLPEAINGNVVKYDAAGRVTSIGSAASFKYLASTHAEKNGYNILMTTAEGEYKLCINKEGWVGYAEKDGMVFNLAYTLAGYLNHMEWKDAASDGKGELVFNYEGEDMLMGRGSCSYPDYSGHIDMTFSYTGSEQPEPIENKEGLIFMNHGVGGFDLGELQWAYYAGLLGKPSRHLAIQKTVVTKTEYSTQEFYEWKMDAEGLPASVTVSEIDNDSDILRYGGHTYTFSWR